MVTLLRGVPPEGVQPHAWYRVETLRLKVATLADVVALTQHVCWDEGCCSADDLIILLEAIIIQRVELHAIIAKCHSMCCLLATQPKSPCSECIVNLQEEVD